MFFSDCQRKIAKKITHEGQKQGLQERIDQREIVRVKNVTIKWEKHELMTLEQAKLGFLPTVTSGFTLIQ